MVTRGEVGEGLKELEDGVQEYTDHDENEPVNHLEERQHHCGSPNLT